jgi:tetratricopeptide (TPR) repeat protein
MNFDHFRYRLRATLFEWLRQPDRALAAWTAVHRADPQDVVAPLGIAWIHAQKKHWDKAAEWFERALAIRPDQADTWFNLGYAREQQGLQAAALTALARAVELNPKHDRAWYGMGMIHSRHGDPLAAAENLRHAADLQPMNGAAWYALGMAHYHANQPDQVAAVFEHCLTHDGPTAKRLAQDTQRPDLVQRLPS